jgi:hypothetical protein
MKSSTSAAMYVEGVGRSGCRESRTLVPHAEVAEEVLF